MGEAAFRLLGAGVAEPPELADELFEWRLTLGPGVMGVMVKERTEDGRDDRSRSLVGVRVPRERRLASLRCRDRWLLEIADAANGGG